VLAYAQISQMYPSLPLHSIRSARNRGDGPWVREMAGKSYRVLFSEVRVDGKFVLEKKIYLFCIHIILPRMVNFHLKACHYAAINVAPHSKFGLTIGTGHPLKCAYSVS
jgi:hypothetical protein